MSKIRLQTQRISSRRPRVPGPIGGRLIRILIRELRLLTGETLPLSVGSHIHCATSAGADSTALLVLLARYGHRICAPNQLHVLHFDHGWRGEKSRAEALQVQSLAASLGVPCTVLRFTGDPFKKGKSPEETARSWRYRELSQILAQHPGDWGLTAHHADDLAETVLWRLCTGAFPEQGGGILPRNGQLLRPLLSIRKQELEAFLKEEGISWAVDSTNYDARFLRGAIRSRISPVLSEVFPKWVERAGSLAREWGQILDETSKPPQERDPSLFQKTAGLRLKRIHFEGWFQQIAQGIRDLEADSGLREVALPGGWRLVPPSARSGPSRLQGSKGHGTLKAGKKRSIGKGRALSRRGKNS